MTLWKEDDMKEVKLIRFFVGASFDDEPGGIKETEDELNTLMRQGWCISAASGPSGLSGIAFLILERDWQKAMGENKRAFAVNFSR